jgi:hypothetical protein
MTGDGSILFGFGEEAVLDTCEANYSKTIYVAEFFNAISSLPLIFLGFYGYSKLHYAESDWFLSCTFLLLCNSFFFRFCFLKNFLRKFFFFLASVFFQWIAILRLGWGWFIYFSCLLICRLSYF